LRLAQGVSVGGELTGTVVGTLITSVLDAEQVAEWGGRLPFLAGVVIAIFGLIMRRGLEHETPPEKAEGRGAIPLPDVWLHHK